VLGRPTGRPRALAGLPVASTEAKSSENFLSSRSLSIGPNTIRQKSPRRGGNEDRRNTFQRQPKLHPHKRGSMYKYFVKARSSLEIQSGPCSRLSEKNLESTPHAASGQSLSQANDLDHDRSDQFLQLSTSIAGWQEFMMPIKLLPVRSETTLCES
jgi:hypothetical protein